MSQSNNIYNEICIFQINLTSGCSKGEVTAITPRMSVLRQRRKPVTQIVTELDAFPKIPETYVEQTVTGAYGKIVQISI